MCSRASRGRSRGRGRTLEAPLIKYLVRNRHIVRLLPLAVLLFIAAPTLAQSEQWIEGYYRKDGTYVEGHYRTRPDGDPYNNYSSPRNPGGATGSERAGFGNAYILPQPVLPQVYPALSQPRYSDGDEVAAVKQPYMPRPSREGMRKADRDFLDNTMYAMAMIGQPLSDAVKFWSAREGFGQPYYSKPFNENLVNVRFDSKSDSVTSVFVARTKEGTYFKAMLVIFPHELLPYFQGAVASQMTYQADGYWHSGSDSILCNFPQLGIDNTDAVWFGSILSR